MVSFRRCILALAVLALFTGLASAQIDVGPGGSTGGALVCTANVANPTAARAEGYAELLGDIVIQCTGGQNPASGIVPTANITVALNNMNVTSRVFGSSRLSEALLMIDEPGVGTLGAGSTLQQQVCTSTTGLGFNSSCGQASIGTYTPTSGTAVVAAINSGAAAPTGGALSAAGGVYNVFQGVVPSGSNQVIFNGIPILAPVTPGFARVFRITNIRGNAASLSNQAGNFQGQIPIQASITISNNVLLQNPVQITAFLFQGLSSSVRKADGGSGTSMTSLPQCGTQGLTSGAVLRFAEGFASAFKTRVFPTDTYSGAATASGQVQAINPSLYTQNVPGTIYNGSESGFILPIGSNTAGLADFGTRLKATFNNVPTGFQLYVTTTNLNPLGNTGKSASTDTSALNSLLGSGIPLAPTSSQTFLAGLVLGETAGQSVQGGFLPLATATNNSGGTILFGPLPVDANGTATAVWEVLQANPSAPETAEFGVWYSYTGNPAQNIPPTSPAGTVSMSFAPTYSTFDAATVIPRFTPPATSSTLISVSLCQTTLLYPWVTSEPGFDTGIAIANTTADPFSTRQQAGTCELSFFGSGAGTPNTVTTPSIGAGTVYAEQVSTLKSGFRGYVIAVCNFTLAHGYALFSDTGIRNWATGYLALVLPNGKGNRNVENVNYSPDKNGVEGLQN